MERLVEYDEGGLPIHLRMRVNKNGEGPIDDSDLTYDHDECWCGIKDCVKWEEI